MITVPAPFTQVGQGCFVQLITANRDLYRNTGPGYYSHFIYRASNALDTAYPYPYMTGAWNLPGSGRFVDVPSQGLVWNPGDGGGGDWYKAVANDSFKVWLMFRPPAVAGQGTTWIPLASYTWYWSGTAERQEGSWVLTQPDSGNSIPGDEFMHPTWNTFSPSPFTLWGVP